MMRKQQGFTLIELLVVISVIAVLMAILMPALNRAREQGKRAMCLGNLKQLTIAWIMYADENDSRIVNGEGGIHRKRNNQTTTNGLDTGIVERAWVGKGWTSGYQTGAQLSQAEQEEAIKQGAMWKICNNLKVYRCPTGRRGEMITYAAVDSVNGRPRHYATAKGTNDWDQKGKRVGNTILWLKKTTDISSPSPGERMVFLDEGWVTPDSFAVRYTEATWWDDPPSRHGGGNNCSYADGHAGYRKWQGMDTIERGKNQETGHASNSWAPTTYEGKLDLYDFQKAVWGKVGYNRPQ